MPEPAAAEPALYAARPKAYPREIGGRFQRLRKLAVLALLGLFYGLPWLTWDDRQAVLFDLPARQFHVFGLLFLPQDFFFLALLLICAALALFFFTAVAGRLWCGYACPQTVWTEVFLWMERWVEGDRARRMRLDKAPWTAGKTLRKTAKHALWIAFSLFTGFTLVSFFTPRVELWQELTRFDLGGWELFWGLFYGFATYGNAGFMRENVCIYMCPYARFQSAMFDRDTLIITYDQDRGEPRGGRARGVDPRSRGLGDCVDCTLCVQVCPTGIDIREGLQYECIGCAACIDACDSVMDRVGYPRGLIRYTTEAAVLGGHTHVLRPRIVIYGLLLLALLTALGTAVALRTPLNVDVIADRGRLYRETADDQIENVYTLKVVNKSGDPERYRASITGLPGATLETDPPRFQVPSAGVAVVPMRIRVPADTLTARVSTLTLTVTAAGGASATQDVRFLGPADDD
ncbi:cytochrome c oxidase accessory protein CcoG [Immundisolibacter sp.]|uniref:cytochrome c oxidase accessory protein CcoG n=1 Tax=Immundisolibacter sp. TaxID=1934948 RepID=UPI0035674CB5